MKNIQSGPRGLFQENFEQWMKTNYTWYLVLSALFMIVTYASMVLSVAAAWWFAWWWKSLLSSIAAHLIWRGINYLFVNAFWDMFKRDRL